MRKGNVEALIKNAEEELVAIRAEYDRSLRQREIDVNLRIDIKKLCESLRSSLDYVAHDIREKHCPSAKPNDRFYFPILPDAASFKKKVATWFPGLQANDPRVWNALESIQPYQTGFDWLGLFNRLNNENKHGDLVEQTRTETHRVNVTMQDGGSVSWDPAGVKFGAGVFVGGVPVDPSTQMPVPHPSQTVEKMIWVDFRFKGIDVSAIDLISRSVSGVKTIVTQIYSIL